MLFKTEWGRSERGEDFGNRGETLTSLLNLEGALGFSASNFVTVPHKLFSDINVDSSSLPETDHSGFRMVDPLITERYAEKVAPHINEISELLTGIEGEPIIVRPSPLDDNLRPDLSFAGAYKGYMPLEEKTREEHILWGTASMLAGRHTEYADYYNYRHSIHGRRQTAAIYMQPFFELGKDIPVFYGTGYIAGGHIRNEYHVLPDPNEQQRDPKLTVIRNGQVTEGCDDQSIEKEYDFTPRVSHLLKGLQENFGRSLDVEYIVDPKGDLYVVQMRNISNKHLTNWGRVKDTPEPQTDYRSAIVNTVGEISGEVIDLRQDENDDRLEQSPKGIVVINYESDGVTGTDAADFLKRITAKDLHSLNVVVDHGRSRLRDHLQYAMVEDPGIDFIVQTHDPEITETLVDGERVTISSDGVILRIAN